MDEIQGAGTEYAQGAKVVDTKEAKALWREKRAVFIDVMPNTPKPAEPALPERYGRTRSGKITAGIWLANVGYGAIPKEAADSSCQGLEVEHGLG